MTMRSLWTSLVLACAAVFAVGCNHPPMPKAGDDFYAFVGTTVTLDGRASVDVDGDAMTYQWSETSGTGIGVVNATDGTATFVAPGVPQDLTFQLMVSDGKSSAADTVTVHVIRDHGPRITLGAEQTVARRSHVTLTAFAIDPDGDPITYTWQQTNGPAVTLQSTTTSWTAFDAPNTECDLDFKLTATDGFNPRTASVTVHVRNAPPTLTQLAVSPALPKTLDDLTVTATATDPDLDTVTLSYSWKRNGTAIAGQSAATLPNAETTRDDVITAVVTASDGFASVTAETSVTILDTPPIFTSDAPTSTGACSAVAFTVTGFDPDGDPVGDVALEHGPAGMQVEAGGAVTWPACQPMFEQALDVQWSVKSLLYPADHLSGTIRISDPARPTVLRRAGLEIPKGHSGLVVADLDGDTKAEALIAGSTGLYELGRSATSYVQRWMSPFSPGTSDVVDAVAAKDLDGDNKAEIFFSSGSTLVKLDGARHEIARNAGTYSCRELELADLTGDGPYEVVCLTSTAVVVLDAATLQLDWQAAVSNGGTLAVGNVDSDAARELVTSSGSVIDGATQVVEWQYAAGFGSIVDTGDLDGDGIQEIVGLGTASVRGFSAVAHSPLWEVTRFDVDALLVADIDADGKSEVLVGDGQWGSVAAYRYQASNNTLPLVFEISAQNHGVSALGVGDTDGDGANEFVWGTGWTSTGEDQLVIAGRNPSIAVEWTNTNPSQLHGTYAGGALARLSSTRKAIMFAAPETDSGYAGTRLIALDPVTGLWSLSAEVGSNWNAKVAIDPADYDGDGVDEILTATSSLYDGYFTAYDFLGARAEWTSPANIGIGVAVAHADFNADGFADMVVLTSDGFLHVYDVKNGALLWKSIDLGTGADLAVADLDADGTPELVALTTSRLYVYYKSTTPLFLERGSVAVAGTALAVGDCDGDSTPELYVVANGAYGGNATVHRYDTSLVELGSFALSAPATAVQIEDLGPGRKNLVVGTGASSYPPVQASLRGLDAVTGAEIWRSPTLWGAVGAQSLRYVDTDANGQKELSFGTTSSMYLTR